jgi:thiol-disulfide isomerase/thioredoxin
MGGRSMSVVDVKMFGAGWCMPCQKAKPHFFDVADTYTLADHDISFDFIDIEEVPFEVVKEEGIASIPRIKVYVDNEYEFDLESRTSSSMKTELDHELYKRLYE